MLRWLPSLMLHRDRTNLGCLCEASWTPPTAAATHQSDGSNTSSSPQAVIMSRNTTSNGSSSGQVIRGVCAAVPSPDGGTAGGPWCYIAPGSCHGNPKTSGNTMMSQCCYQVSTSVNSAHHTEELPSSNIYMVRASCTLLYNLLSLS